MRNRDFIKLVIHCKDCIHRYTEECPMYITIVPSGRYADAYFIDKTEDNWFCSEGEKYDN